ncbi:uncharacterized protein ZBIST_0285 [Zygosaccharomyces bailii]|nr:uncharacterized protein ZBIST_0285 [Zygosaccharomyces bailii]
MLHRLHQVPKMTELNAALSELTVAERSTPQRGHPPPLASSISVDEQTGEVMVRKSTGKIKIRKGQSHEEYEKQLHDYFEINKGPKRTEEQWMDNISAVQLLEKEDLSVKLTRQSLTNFCQRLYYQRKYPACASLSQELLQRYNGHNKKNKMQKEIEELEYLVSRSKENDNSTI